MKKLFLILSMFCLIANNSRAQDDQDKKSKDEFQTLLNSDSKISHGIYTGFELGFVNVDNHSGLLGGLNIAWVIDHSVEFGVVGKGFITSPKPNASLDNLQYLYAGGYGGFHFAGTLYGSKPINLSFPVTVGGGALGYMESFNSYHNYNNYPFYPEENVCVFLLLEPGIDLQLNITRYFRISIGAAYRYTTDLFVVDSSSENLLVNPHALRGMNYSVKFKIGLF